MLSPDKRFYVLNLETINLSMMPLGEIKKKLSLKHKLTIRSFFHYKKIIPDRTTRNKKKLKIFLTKKQT